MYEFVLLLNALVWLSLVFYYAGQPYASAFHPITYYLFFHGFIFTFRPIVVYTQGYTALYQGYGFTPTIEDKTTVILGAMLGMIFFVGAAMRSGNTPMRFSQDAAHDKEREVLKRPFLFVAGLLLPLGVIATLASWNTRSNEASSMVLDSATGHYINTTTSGYFIDLQLLIAPCVIMFAWLFKFRWWTWVMLGAFIVLRGGTGGRWPIMMACATIALMFLYERRKKFPNLKALALVVAALWLFQVVGADRGATIRNFFIEDNSLAAVNYNRRELGFLEAMDFANLEFYEYIVYAVPQRTETYGYFLNNLQVFTEPVPRMLWPGKPVGPPIKLFSLFDYGYPIGMTYSLPGEGWMQLGYLGVAIWCGLFGWFYGWIYTKFQRSKQSNLALIAFLLFLPLSLQFFRDGLLLTMIKTHAWFLLPVILLYAFARFSAVPLLDDLRMMAMRRVSRQPRDVAFRARKLRPDAQARRGKATPRKPRWPAE